MLMVGWLFCLSVIAVGQPQDSPVLLPASPIEREIASGQSHPYQIALMMGQSLKLKAEQLSSEVALTLLSPEGKQLAEETLPEGNRGTKLLLWLPQSNGVYQFKVVASDKSKVAGRYRLSAELEPADEKRTLAIQKFNEGMQIRKSGKRESYPQALRSFTEALPLWRALKDSLLEASTLQNLGWVSGRTGNHQQSVAYYQQALSLFRVLEMKAEQAEVMSNIADRYLSLSELPNALEYYQRAVAQRDFLAPLNVGILLDNLGQVYANLGDHRKALAMHQQALALFQELGVRKDELVTLPRIARAQRLLGNYSQALELLNRGLQLSRELKLPSEEAFNLQQVGQLYAVSGDTMRGIEYLERAAAVCRAEKIRSCEMNAVNQLGQIYKDQGASEKALTSFNEVLIYVREIGSRVSEGITNGHLGDILAARGAYEQALSHQNQAIDVLRKVGARQALVVRLIRTAETYTKTGQHEQAKALLTEAATINQEIGSNRDDAQIFRSLAALARDEGQLQPARELLEKSLQAIERQRTVGLSQSLRTTFGVFLHQYYQDYVEILMALHAQSPTAGYAVLALSASERVRARSLLDLLSEARVDWRTGIDPVLLEKERVLQEQISARETLRRQLVENKRTAEHAKTYALEISDLLIQLQTIEAEIRTTSPRYAALTQPVPLTAAEIQQRVLDDDTVLLEYSLDQKRSYLWAVTTKEIHSFVLPGENEIETAARRWLDLLPKSTQRRYQRETELAAAELSRLILAPAAAHLQKKRLVIVADGLLQYVPFAALPKPVVGENTKANQPPATSHQPLIKEHELVSLPSASALAVLRTEIKGRPTATKQLAIFSDPVFEANDPRVQLAKTNRAAPAAPTEGAKELVAQALTRAAAEAGIMSFVRLPFARQEAEAIAKLIPKDQQLKALDFTASRQTALTGQLEQYRHLHFATHGLLSSQHPELSGIVLSLVDENGKVQDGFLRLSDLYNLKLNADLVVLSACQTALGKDVRGEGLVGLTRGFMYAGAARIVASLWNVNDAATAELMQKFYRAMIVEKLAPAAALRSAQLAMARDPRWAPPYYWSGFVLQGEWK